MIDPRYIKFLAAAAVVSGMFALLMWFGGSTPRLGPSVSGFALGMLVTSFITVRLPIFRRYYDATSHSDLHKYGGMANGQASWVLAGLAAAAAVASVMYAFGVEDVVDPAFLGGVGAGVVSEYHKKKR